MTTSEGLDELLSKIGKGISLVRKERIPDTKDIQEEANLEAERKLAHLANEWLLIDLRKKYGRNIINFMWVYFVFAGVTLTLHGFNILGFSLPDIALAAIVGATAVSVLGVVGTVAAGLFKPPSP